MTAPARCAACARGACAGCGGEHAGADCLCAAGGHPHATRNEHVLLAAMAGLTGDLATPELAWLLSRSPEGTARTCTALADRLWLRRVPRQVSGFGWRITDRGRLALAGLPPLPRATPR